MSIYKWNVMIFWKFLFKIFIFKWQYIHSPVNKWNESHAGWLSQSKHYSAAFHFTSVIALLHYVQQKDMYASWHAVLTSHFLSAADENSQAQEVRLQSWADCSSQIQTIEDELKTCVLSLKEQVKNAIQRSKQSWFYAGAPQFNAITSKKVSKAMEVLFKTTHWSRNWWEGAISTMALWSSIAT